MSANYQSSPHQQKNSSSIPDPHSSDGAHDINIKKKSTCVSVTDTQFFTEAESHERATLRYAPPNALYEMQPINGQRQLSKFISRVFSPHSPTELLPTLQPKTFPKKKG